MTGLPGWPFLSPKKPLYLPGLERTPRSGQGGLRAPPREGPHLLIHPSSLFLSQGWGGWWWCGGSCVSTWFAAVAHPKFLSGSVKVSLSLVQVHCHSPFSSWIGARGESGQIVRRVADSAWHFNSGSIVRRPLDFPITTKEASLF